MPTDSTTRSAPPYHTSAFFVAFAVQSMEYPFTPSFRYRSKSFSYENLEWGSVVDVGKPWEEEASRTGTVLIFNVLGVERVKVQERAQSDTSSTYKQYGLIYALKPASVSSAAHAMTMCSRKDTLWLGRGSGR